MRLAKPTQPTKKKTATIGRPVIFGKRGPRTAFFTSFLITTQPSPGIYGNMHGESAPTRSAPITVLWIANIAWLHGGKNILFLAPVAPMTNMGRCRWMTPSACLIACHPVAALILSPRILLPRGLLLAHAQNAADTTHAMQKEDDWRVKASLPSPLFRRINYTGGDFSFFFFPFFPLSFSLSLLLSVNSVSFWTTTSVSDSGLPFPIFTANFIVRTKGIYLDLLGKRLRSSQHLLLAPISFLFVMVAV